MSVVNQQTSRYKRDRIYEQLAKPGKGYSVYSNKHCTGDILLKEYQVEQIFQDKPSGFYALGLVSVYRKNPPVLVIRGFGTWGKLEDFPREFFPYNDIPDVVMTHSDEQFQAAKKVGAIAWLQDKTTRGMKPDVVGQSLGGKVAQQLAVEVPDCIHALVTFNPIGISLREFEAYQGNIQIFHYINPADLFPYVLGEKFLPGTILQVGNSKIKNWDLLGQHNNLVLDNSVTVLQEVKIETFDFIRELYKSIQIYAKILKKEIAGLSQIATAEVTNYEINFNSTGQSLSQNFEKTQQIVQQELDKIILSIRQRLLDNLTLNHSNCSFQKQVNDSVEIIQRQIESLNQVVQREISESSKPLNSFSQTVQQELTESVNTIKQKLNQFL